MTIVSLAFKKPVKIALRNPVKILVIFGNSENIDLKPDEELLAKLEKRGARITPLTQPTRRELRYRLSEQRWDLLFFAGHSYSEKEGESGFIQLKEDDSISLKELESDLSQAVRNGLKLAIFNSCDGLEIARNLANFRIPYVIFMREPVPDRVAQRFLEYFLFRFSSGESLDLSVRYARQRLQDEEREHQLPCASWLPAIYQNPTAPTLKWLPPTPRIAVGVAIAFLVSIIPLSLIIYKRIHPSIPHRISMGEEILVKENVTSEKKKGVKAFEEKDFARAASEFQASLQKQRNDPETLIYLNNARNGDKSSYKIIVSVPIGSNLDVAQEILRGVAQAQNEIDRKGGINGKPLQVAIANDENNPDLAIQLANTFIEDPQTLAVVGHNSSDASVAAAPVYNRGGLVMITPTSFSDKLSSSGDYIFRMVPTIRFLTDTLSDYIVHTAHKTKIAVCSSRAAVDNESFRNQFINSFQAEGKQYINVKCDFDDPQYNPEEKILEIVSSGADSLLLAPHVDRIGKAVEMAQANQGRLTLFGSPTLYTYKTLKEGQQAVNGIALVAPWHPDTLPYNAPFRKQARQLWGGEVNWRSAQAYDATMAITAALQQSQTREGLKNTLTDRTFSVEGVTGTIKFLPSGDRQFIPGSGLIAKVKPNPKTSGYKFVLLPR
ncbi:hypothetical protein NIES593_02460 [Hydrococcus rivularis NIES-593]|uniref:LEM domain-containing protein n=1 Tax=Hydrococcus rivularis NIES-593 TaxID=1921803 RepID=A0A1U7HQZ5_9CYAN|nr:ABC transporter substrate-binding protein [Hydrococcus rivularis]OKH25968.1 hypothetical protein NIES593_02460 [Hydrococcus rivularis NIES-593]